MAKKVPCVYIMSNKSNSVLYMGVTSDPVKRIYEHKEHVVDGFSTRYNVDKLVCYEVFEDMFAAIDREKQIKGWSRKKKMDLVQRSNPEWKDLYEEIAF